MHLSKFQSRTSSRGFTLIELLLVIGIIIILASLVIVNVSKARAKGRDSKRVADLSTIQLAMEMYKDSHGAYLNCTVATPPPCPLGNNVPEPPGNWFGFDTQPNFTTAIQNYLTPVPKDPGSNPGNSYLNNYQILIDSAGGKYWIVAKLESTDNAPAESEIGNCYKVSNSAVASSTTPTGSNYTGYPLMCN